MSKQYDDSNRGILFVNDRKEQEKDRDYSGSLNVDGHDYWVSGWKRKSKNGQTFLSLSVKRKDGGPERKPASAAQTHAQEMDDEIPF